MDKINAKIRNLSIDNLKEMAVMLFNDNREGTEIVMTAILNKMESIMPETEFVSFCDAMQ